MHGIGVLVRIFVNPHLPRQEGTRKEDWSWNASDGDNSPTLVTVAGEREGRSEKARKRGSESRLKSSLGEEERALARGGEREESEGERGDA